MGVHDYVGSLCQSCGGGVYANTEQGVECDKCGGLVVTGALPPISPYLDPEVRYKVKE